MTGAVWALVGSLLLSLVGLVMLAFGLSSWRRHKRFLAAAQGAPGVVSHMQPDHEGDDDAVIGFTPLVGAGAGRPTLFANGFDTPAMQIGQAVWVLYDPANPGHAVVSHGLRAKSDPTARTILGLGGMLAVLGAAFAVTMPFVVQNHSDMMQSGYDFAAAVRRGDREAMRALAVPGANLDLDYLDQVVAPSKSLDCASSASGFSDGCTRCVTGPIKAVVYFSFVKRGETWRVRSARPHDNACAEQLD